MEARSQIDTLYTDFAKAFESVDHTILVSKLNHAGIRGNMLRWFESYLNNRSQLAALPGYESSPFIPTSSVHQGSKLGPLLFIFLLKTF